MSAIKIVDQPSPSTTVDASPGAAGTPPRPNTPVTGQRWPRAAVLLVAVLAVLALLGIAGTALGFAGSDADADPDRLEELEEDLAEAQAARDNAVTRADELDAEAALLRARVGGAEAERDELADRLATAGEERETLRASIAELDVQIAASRADLADFEQARDEAVAQVDRLEDVVTLARQQAVAAVAERDAIVQRFPLTVEPTFDVAELTGTYNAAWREAFCSGLATCGTVPIVRTAAIRTTSEGYLRIELGSLATTNLARVGSGLHAVANSTTAVPACNGAARAATVTLTLAPAELAVDTAGAAEIVSASAVVTIESPATGACPAVLAFYGVGLDPVA